MEKLVELYDKIDELRQDVLIDNDTDNKLVDAYNRGVDAMAAQIRNYINVLALKESFKEAFPDGFPNGGEQ